MPWAPSAVVAIPSSQTSRRVRAAIDLGMESEFVEYLVDLFGVTGYGEPGDNEILRSDSGHRGPVLDVVASRKQIVGVDTHRQLSTDRSIKRSSNPGPVTCIEQDRQTKLGQIRPAGRVDIGLTYQLGEARPDPARDERCDIRLLPNGEVLSNRDCELPTRDHAVTVGSDQCAVLYNPRVSAILPEDSVRAWKPNLPGVTEVLHASFADHAYQMHCHDSWTVLLIDAGMVRYGIQQHDRGADTRRVTILPPFVAHDGKSAVSGRGFRKRVLYIDTATIAEELVGSAVDDSTVDDPQLRAAISDLHAALDRPEDDLEWETRLGLVVARIESRLRRGDTSIPLPVTRAAKALRDYLDSRPFDRHRLSEIAATLGWSTNHLIRSFTRTFGIPPHRYLISRRLDEARRLLLAGQPAAEVAIGVGFHDQAHLTRHFKAHLATTPARYQRSNR